MIFMGEVTPSLSIETAIGRKANRPMVVEFLYGFSDNEVSI